ncbi:hypothetical protein D5F01_LYC05452 [Larimichthys crocea]|uniref:Uncharacterized protein n=1 Tax=Larimichthys crocea TaxID=215358 RepID=A0A6G0IZG9_LARCR|nr:hypothetical protein D5F01_LYC05452 [Larimichthys crocea]
MTAQLKPPATGKYQQSIKTSSCQTDMEKKHHSVKGQAEAGRVSRHQRQPQGVRQPAEFIRGPDQRRTAWVPPEHRTPVREISIDIEDAAFKRGPVKHKKLWTPPSRNNHQHAAAKAQQADRVSTCNQVKASAALVEQLKKMQAKPCNEIEASPQQAMIYVSELKYQQFQRQTDRITKLKNGNEALAAEMEQLKKMLQMNKTLHDETEKKRMDKVMDLELQLSEKKASEAKALCKVQELEKTLQRQKDSRAEQHLLLAQQEEDITKLKTALIQTQEELKSHRLHRQEERSLLNENLRDIQHALQEEKAMQEREQQMKRVEKSLSLKKDSHSSLSKLEASISPQANPPLNYTSSMPTAHPIITSS